MLNSECGLCSHNEIASLLVFDFFLGYFVVVDGRELFRGRLQLLVSRNHGALLGSTCLSDFSPLDCASQVTQPSLGYCFLSRQFQSCHRLLAECSMPRNQLAPVTWYLTPQLGFPSSLSSSTLQFVQSVFRAARADSVGPDHPDRNS
jgi:hypothetical protein